MDSGAVDQRLDRAQDVLVKIVVVGLVVWEAWLLVSLWRGGRLPIPFVDVSVEGSPLIAVLFFVFGTPLLGFVGVVITMVLGLPLALVAGASAARDVKPRKPAVPRCAGSGSVSSEKPHDDESVVCVECGHEVRTVEAVPGKWKTADHTIEGHLDGPLPDRWERCPGSHGPAPSNAEVGAFAECPVCGLRWETYGAALYGSLSMVDHFRPLRSGS